MNFETIYPNFKVTEAGDIFSGSATSFEGQIDNKKVYVTLMGGSRNYSKLRKGATGLKHVDNYETMEVGFKLDDKWSCPSHIGMSDYAAQFKANRGVWGYATLSEVGDFLKELSAKCTPIQ
jgi:hypothetical protein